MRALVFSSLLWVSAIAAEAPQPAVASAHPLATEVGVAILRAGGNAFDAAVAVSAALAVVEPYSSGLGGGGFWLLHRAGDGYQVMIDGREKAPGAAYREMFLDQQGEVMPGASIDGPLAAAIPGAPAALVHIATHYGRLPLRRTLAPAMQLARKGFPVTEGYRRLAGFRVQALRGSPGAAAVFLVDNQVPSLGYLIVQSQLADTLEALAERGWSGFYQGEIASRLVEGVRKAGGLWTLDDLAQYRVLERQPVIGEYRGIRIVSAAPPSSGGIVLIEALNILENYDLDRVDSSTRTHLIIEALRRAYRDRAEYLGDPDFVEMPVERLISQSYADRLRTSIHPQKAIPSESLPGISRTGPSGIDTTHFSIIDAQGNRVAATLSINYAFGSGYVVPGTGVLLNNEMDDFSAKPLTPNVYGLVGSAVNAISARKRPLSSMTPTFLETSNRIGILGTPGGSRIISMVLLASLDFAAGRPPQSWVGLGRFHHQYLPDEVQFEIGVLDTSTRQALRRRGHRLKALDRAYGNMQAILWDRRAGLVQAVSDPRGEGRAQVLRNARGTAEYSEAVWQ